MSEPNAGRESVLERKAELADRFARNVPAVRMAWRLNDRARLRRAIDEQAALLADYEALEPKEHSTLARS